LAAAGNGPVMEKTNRENRVIRRTIDMVGSSRGLYPLFTAAVNNGRGESIERRS
jgi:hypothetical protein